MQPRPACYTVGRAVLAVDTSQVADLFRGPLLRHRAEPTSFRLAPGGPARKLSRSEGVEG